MSLPRDARRWRRVLAVVAAVAALVICGQGMTAVHARAATFAGNYWVHLDVAENPWCLDANTTQGGVNGTRVQIWTCNQQSQQEWAFYQVSGDIYDVVNVRFGKCLDADFNHINQNGDQVQLWTCNGSQWQQWVFPGIGGSPLGIFPFSCYYNLNALDADNSRPIGNGTKVQLWWPTGGLNQNWSIKSP